MADGDSRPGALSKAEARHIVREISMDADRIILHPHARMRLVQRMISVTQVRTVIRTGTIVEGPYLDDKDCWRVEMQGRAAGDTLSVAVAILWPQRLLVITVYQPNERKGRR